MKDGQVIRHTLAKKPPSPKDYEKELEELRQEKTKIAKELEETKKMEEVCKKQLDVKIKELKWPRRRRKTTRGDWRR